MAERAFSEKLEPTAWFGTKERSPADVAELVGSGDPDRSSSGRSVRVPSNACREPGPLAGSSAHQRIT